jgi:serine/threonine protein kinase
VGARGSQLETGTVVAGYRIDGLISRGGMGMVYRATNLTLNRGYALKVIAPELADDDEFRLRFQREIRIAASLDHPNVVPIHYAGEHEGMLFLAMDYVDGTDLRNLITRDGALVPTRAVAILAQVTSALDAAHHNGLVHRDVKPANILICTKDGDEHAFLTDFGLAKRFDNATAVTMKGAVVGTVDYMPPEQITGDPTDARTDIYALGCVFFQMLTGKVPYQRDNSVATLFAHVYDAPPSLVGPAAAAHATLGPVIAKAMAKSAAERYLSAGDFARDAAAALQGSRYTGPQTMVATGEARPEDDAGEPTAQSAQRTLEAMQAAVAEAGTPAGTGSQSHPAPPRRTEPSAPAERESSSPPRGAPAWKRRWPVLAGLAVLAVAVIVIAVVVSGSSSSPAGQPFATALNPVPTNRVTASGSATIRLDGDVATVTVTTKGLLNGAAHAMHIHAGGEGICPPATAARLHDGHRTISTTNAARYYGSPVVSLTTVGDTSPKSIVDFTRYPTAGDIHYQRTISLPPAVVTDIRENNAVVIIHGIDYNGDGVYDDSLGISDLSNRLTEESTDPALCGPLAAVTHVAGLSSRGPSVYTASLGVNAALSGKGGMGNMDMGHMGTASRTPMPQMPN